MSVSDLRPLAGRWSTKITLIHPVEAKGEVHRALDTYRFLPGDLVLIHEVNSGVGADPVNSIEIIYNSDDGDVVSRNYDSRGETSSYHFDLTDGVLRIQGDTERFVSNVLQPDRIEGLWELLTGGDWVDWMIVRLDRLF